MELNYIGKAEATTDMSSQYIANLNNLAKLNILNADVYHLASENRPLSIVNHKHVE